MIVEPAARLMFMIDEGAAHARVSGPVNRETAALFRRRLEPALASRCRAVALDLGAAEYVDSDGVRWLQQLQRELGDRGIALRLVLREGCRAERTLKLLRLEGIFTIDRYPNEAPVQLQPGK